MGKYKVKKRADNKYIYFDIEKIDQYNKIIIYGAGIYGRQLLKALNKKNVCRSFIEVWDKNAQNIDSLYGYKVQHPDFSSLLQCNKTAVVIALSLLFYSQLIPDLIKKYKKAGLNNVFLLDFATVTEDEFFASNFTGNDYSDCYYQADTDFSKYKPKVKVLAYYLPQFHEIPENNEWWGSGFTEWSNVKTARPGYCDHYQPREPHDDFGYYDLSDPNVIKKQAELAKRHGIFGWCMYYYWFSGKKLLEKPIDLLLENKDIDISFCLMWCNETWSKRWIGDDAEILIKSEHREGDPEKFVDDIKVYTDDRRYIRLHGKPVVIIYNPEMIPDLNNHIKQWQNHAVRIGIGELYVIINSTRYNVYEDNKLKTYDATLDFNAFKSIENYFCLLNDEGFALSEKMAFYKEWIDTYIDSADKSENETLLTCSIGYDNSPRYKNGFANYNVGFSLDGFYNLSEYIINDAINNNKDFVFIFAWNEWCESAYLEPDKKYGYAVINTLSKAIYGLPFKNKKENS